MTRLLLWRHGQTDYNLQARIQGWSDIELNDSGRAQAEQAAPAIADLGPTRIISSDLARAQATAQVLARLTGLRVEIDERLRERCFGQLEGLTREEIAERFPEEAHTWRTGRAEGRVARLGIEGRLAAGSRLAQVVDDWEKKPDDLVVIVAHGGIISAALTILLGINPDEFHPFGGLGNCHWAVLAPQTDRAPSWRLLEYNAGPPVFFPTV